jgi:hypothetical protein
LQPGLHWRVLWVDGCNLHRASQVHLSHLPSTSGPEEHARASAAYCHYARCVQALKHLVIVNHAPSGSPVNWQEHVTCHLPARCKLLHLLFLYLLPPLEHILAYVFELSRHLQHLPSFVSAPGAQCSSMLKNSSSSRLFLPYFYYETRAIHQHRQLEESQVLRNCCAALADPKAHKRSGSCHALCATRVLPGSQHRQLIAVPTRCVVPPMWQSPRRRPCLVRRWRGARLIVAARRARV